MKSILRHSIGVYVEVLNHVYGWGFLACSFSDNMDSDQCNIGHVVIDIRLSFSNPLNV